jgi:hypothetical protein
MLRETILKELKKKLTSQGKINDLDFIRPGVFNTNQVDFYLDDYNKNLIRKMSVNHYQEFLVGNGQEFDDNEKPAKMKSLHSSSAMTFNILGNDSIEILPNQSGIKDGVYSVQFEKKLPTLKKSNAPANLDACLLHEDKTSVVFCEMKMFEWFDKNRKMDVAPAYHNVLRYYDTDAFSVFNEVFKQLVVSGIVRYDVLQMMKHTLGIYNILFKSKMSDGEFSKVDSVTLLNCVWEVTKPDSLGKSKKQYMVMIREEHNGFAEFYNLYQPIVKLFKMRLQIDLRLLYINHHDFIALIKKSSVEMNYLKRYEI